VKDLVELILILLIVLLMTGAAGVGLFYSTLYRHPYMEESCWRVQRKQHRQEPPEYIWLQYYQTGTPRVTWTSIGFLAHHDDVMYRRVDESRTD